MDFHVFILLAIVSVASTISGQGYGGGSGGYLPLAFQRQQPVFRPILPNNDDVIEMPRQSYRQLPTFVADETGGLQHYGGRPQRPLPVASLSDSIRNELAEILQGDQSGPSGVQESRYGGGSGGYGGGSGGYGGGSGGYFDYDRGCCKQKWPGCRRPLCNSPGFDYYDEVHHCCHRRTSGCRHRPLCGHDYGYYNRRHHCCNRRTRGCHRPLCGRHHGYGNHHHNDHYHRDRRSCGRHGSSSSHHGSSSSHHSSSRRRSSSSDESRVHRRSGSRSRERDSKYPAFFPYLHTNGTKQIVNQHVNVDVKQDQHVGCQATGGCSKK